VDEVRVNSMLYASVSAANALLVMVRRRVAPGGFPSPARRLSDTAFAEASSRTVSCAIHAAREFAESVSTRMPSTEY
jgi:hypothetical protein